MNKLVIYTEDEGVYLGSCLGLGFWSKLDPVGQQSAVTFENAEEVAIHIQNWPDDQKVKLRLVEVIPDLDGYASIQAIVHAGLPGWLDEVTPIANNLPV